MYNRLYIIGWVICWVPAIVDRILLVFAIPLQLDLTMRYRANTWYEEKGKDGEEREKVKANS